MRVVPMFPASALGPLLRYVEREAGRPTRLFGRTLALLRDSNALIPLSAGGQILERAARALGLPDIGLRAAENAQIEQIGEFGVQLRALQTLGGALEVAARSGSRVNTGQRFWLEHHGSDVRLHRRYARALVRGRTQASDYALTLSLQLIRLAAGPRWRPTEIHFEGAPPEHAERLASLAERSVYFDSPQTTVVFPRRLLGLPLPERPTTRRLASRGALPSPDPVTSLRQAIEALLRMGSVDVRDAAVAAGMSVRSFQRQFAAAGLSFSQLLAQERFREARRLLVDPDTKVIDVALRLGYSDPANFTRAFRRWAGISPQEFRHAAAELPEIARLVTPQGSRELSP